MWRDLWLIYINRQVNDSLLPLCAGKKVKMITIPIWSAHVKYTSVILSVCVCVFDPEMEKQASLKTPLICLKAAVLIQTPVQTISTSAFLQDLHRCGTSDVILRSFPHSRDSTDSHIIGWFVGETLTVPAAELPFSYLQRNWNFPSGFSV